MDTEPPKLLTISQLTWTGPWINNIQNKIGALFTIDSNCGLKVSDDVTQADFNTAAAFLWKSRESMGITIRLINRLLGEMILDYSARFNVGWTDAIEALGLGNSDKSMSSLKKLPRIVQRLSPEVLSIEGLKHSHFEMATGFAGPEEPDKQREWNERIADILRRAAECPEDRPAKWVGDCIRAMQKEFGIDPQRPVGGKVLLDQYAVLNYILEHWTTEQFLDAGHERSKVLDHRDDVENELINRGILQIPDAKNFVPPWKDQPKEADQVDIMEPGEAGPMPGEEPEIEVLPPASEDDDEDLPVLE